MSTIIIPPKQKYDLSNICKHCRSTFVEWLPDIKEFVDSETLLKHYCPSNNYRTGHYSCYNDCEVTEEQSLVKLINRGKLNDEKRNY